MSGYGMIPAATSMAGQNNNVGGIGALNSPWGGSGMDLSYAGQLLDPAGLSGNGGLTKNAAEAFFDPAGIDSGSSGLNLFGQRGNNATGASTTMPNLGASTMIPNMPGGAWGMSPYGAGPFNNMANQSAGQIFTPSGIQAQNQPATSNLGGSKPSINTGGTQYSPNALPGGGGNPALGSTSGSALSRSQIYGGNVGPNGITEPSDPAFLNNLHNGMMQYLKAQGNLPNGGGGYNRNGGPR